LIGQQGATASTKQRRGGDVAFRDRGPARSARPQRKGFWRDTIESVLVALVIFLVIRTFAFQAFRIPTGSMENTLLPGDFLFINKFAYGARVPFTEVRLPGYTHPQRGDIIVFEYPRDPKQDYIKRCIGVAGDVIEMRNKQLYVNGIPQDEPYAVHKDARLFRPGDEDPQILNHLGNRDNFGPYRVPPGSIFMMGDNRDQSYDSRFWGPVDMHLVHGRAWVTYFSWDPNRHLPRPSRMFHLIH
jgi:signal peptidase I